MRRKSSRNVDSKLRVEYPGTIEKEELENHSSKLNSTGRSVLLYRRNSFRHKQPNTENFTYKARCLSTMAAWLEEIHSGNLDHSGIGFVFHAP